MAENSTIHLPAHARAIAEAIEAAEALDARLDAVGCWAKGSFEVWCSEGFRLGIVVYEDDAWRFHLNYAEPDDNE